jgi:hypothetical protein
LQTTDEQVTLSQLAVLANQMGKGGTRSPSKIVVLHAIPAPARILKFLPLPDRIARPLRQIAESENARGKWNVARLLAVPGFGLGSLHEILRIAEDLAGSHRTTFPTGKLEDEIATIVTTRKRKDTLEHVPLLTRAIEIVAQGAPASEKVTLANIEAEGISRGEVRLADIERACRFLGDSLPFRILRRGEMTLVVTPSQFSSAERVQAVAVRTVASWGAASTSQVSLHADVPDTDFVTHVVQAHSEFQWLAQSSGWFWFANPRSRLVRAIRAAHFKTEARGIEHLASALFARRPSEFVLPAPVLAALIQQIPDLCAP